MTDRPCGEPADGVLVEPTEAEGYDTFPFRPGDRVEVKYPDPMWDDDDREFNLVVGWQGTVTEVCWNPVWTTHVMVEFDNKGRLCVGWDVIKLVERPDEPRAGSRIRSRRILRPSRADPRSREP
jgi:hypothetical protein